MTLALFERDDRPARMRQHFIGGDSVAIDARAAFDFVTHIKIFTRADPTGLQIVTSKTPALGAEPGNIEMRIIPMSKLPVENGG